MTDKNYYTDVEVARKLNKPYSEILRLANRGGLPVTYVDDTRMFPKQAIDYLVAQQASVGKPTIKQKTVGSSALARGKAGRKATRQSPKTTSKSLKPATPKNVGKDTDKKVADRAAIETPHEGTPAGVAPGSSASKPDGDKTEESKEYFTLEQIASALQRSQGEVDQMVRWGEIKVTTFDGRRWASREEVERIISKRDPQRQARIRRRLIQSRKNSQQPLQGTLSDAFTQKELTTAAQRMGTSLNRVREMIDAGEMIREPESGLLLPAKKATGNLEPGSPAIGAKKPGKNQKHFTAEEAAQYLGESVSNIFRRIRNKELPLQGSKIPARSVLNLYYDTKLGQQESPVGALEEYSASQNDSGRDITHSPREALEPDTETEPAASAEDGRTGSEDPATTGKASTRDSSGSYSAEEVAAKLGKDVDEVWEMVYRDQLPIVRVGGMRKFPEGAVKDLLDDRGTPSSAAEGDNEVSVRPTDENGDPVTTPRNSPEVEATGPKDKPSPRLSAARESGADQEVWMLEDELRAERERNERLDEELQQERAVHDQEMAQVRYEIDYLEAEIENLRRDRAALSENLHEDLEEERYKRVRAENTAEQLRDDLHEEIERRMGAERVLEGSDAGGDLYGRLSSGLKGVVESLTGAVPDEDQREQDDLGSQLEGLRAQLEVERSNRLEKEELAAGLQSSLEQGEAKIRETENALAAEREQRLRLEYEKRVLDEVRRLLGAQGGGQLPQPESGTEAREPRPTTDEPDGQQPEALVLTTPYGRYVFDPPFPLSDQESELLRFVAREVEVTEDQIRRNKGRRALQTLNALLDRLADEGTNPILEVNDRYGFDRSILQSD